MSEPADEIDAAFSGYGIALRREGDPAIPGEPLMSMADAKRITRQLLSRAQPLHSAGTPSQAIGRAIKALEPFAKHAESAMLLDLISADTRANLEAARASKAELEAVLAQPPEESERQARKLHSIGVSHGWFTGDFDDLDPIGRGEFLEIVQAVSNPSAAMPHTQKAPDHG